MAVGAQAISKIHSVMIDLLADRVHQIFRKYNEIYKEPDKNRIRASREEHREDYNGANKEQLAVMFYIVNEGGDMDSSEL